MGPRPQTLAAPVATHGRDDRSATRNDGDSALNSANCAVMPGRVPGIHVFGPSKEDVDGRDKPGHDGQKYPSPIRRHYLDR